MEKNIGLDLNSVEEFSESEVSHTDALIQNRESSLPMEPIAIIGMACRFPGALDISEFWQLLEAGKNLVVEGPPGSIIGRSGRQFPTFDSKNDAVRFGAFVEDIDFFDAEFFRMSPMEAQMLDPQQRLMLETSWQALEDAAIDPESLRGSRTGVYAGISNNDYRDVVIDSPETAEPAGGLYAVTGTALNTAIGRVSFALGLEGPNMAIDTACSSSLVAIHQAVGGLQRNDTDLALAGGVHIFLSGRPLELRANAGMLSPQGQCKTFDASADGFVCGEGCGLVVLKRLSEAQNDGDRIWAVIRGSSVNQDGASQGLTVPSGPSQERAMEDALACASLVPSETDYLETHGTGTVVGDPIEVNAAAAVYGRGREDRYPLLMGSVKTNIGHLGAAAGIAGLIKTVLSMRYGVIPRHLNFKDPNPNLDWDRLPVRVTDEMMAWPKQADKLPLAGVNSFGWSGTNAHVLVQGYESPNTDSKHYGLINPVGAAVPVSGTPTLENNPRERETRFLPLSGKSEKALRDSASRYLSWLDERKEEIAYGSTASNSILSDMVWTASVGRSHFQNRAGVVFHDVAGLKESLETVSNGKEQYDGPVHRPANKVAFVFTGQASQWVGMGKGLYETEPVFRKVLEQCSQMLYEARGVSLLEVMFAHHGLDDLLDEPSWTQPAIYSLECALVAIWKSVGVKPDVVIGHSLGEIAAAQAAGVFTLEEGLRYAAVRGELMGDTRSDGAMAAIFAPAARVAAVIAEYNATSDDVGVSIAVDNGLQQVISGPSKDLEAVQTTFEREEIKVVRLKRSPAYHSALVEPALDDLESALETISPTPPPASLPLISNVSGQVLDEYERMDASYWRRHAREPVAFRSSVETLADLGVDAVVEIGPQAVLGPVVSMIWPESSATEIPVIIHSLQRPAREGEIPTIDTSGGFVEAVARAYEAGLDVNFNGLFDGEIRRRISLPNYPFQRDRHWVQISNRRRQTAGHPLLGAKHELPRGSLVYESEMYPSEPAWLTDHLVYDRIVAPGATYGAMAVSSCFLIGNDLAVVDDMQIHSPLIFEHEDKEPETNDAGRKLQFVSDAPSDTAERHFEIYSKGYDSEESWTFHAAGKLVSEEDSDFETMAPIDLSEIRSNLISQSPQQFYQARYSGDIHLGPSYHTIAALWSKSGEALGELVLPEFVDANGMELHPLLLDGCFQVLAIARHQAGIGQGAVYVPFGWERLYLVNPIPERIVCHAVLRESSSSSLTDEASKLRPEIVTGDANLYTSDGNLIGRLEGYMSKRATQAALLPTRKAHEHLIYEVDWKEQPIRNNTPAAYFLENPSAVANRLRPLTDYLSDEGVKKSDRVEFLKDQEHLSQAYALTALEQLGWKRESGTAVQPEQLRLQLKVVDSHQRLFNRLLDMLTIPGILKSPKESDGFMVEIGVGDSVMDKSLTNPESLFEQLVAKYPHGTTELHLLGRCGSALAEVLLGITDPLPLLFSDDGPSAADLYLNAPASRAANLMLKDAVVAAVHDLPNDRRLRVVEVGAGTGSATSAILPALPLDRVEYAFTDISAGFFAEAESRLSKFGANLQYSTLNIEEPPESQGFSLHGYDLVIAANVLHATRDLGETLAHCRNLLADSGQLVALEGLQRRSWQDLTFGLLDGWWRFADSYRSEHALASPSAWRQALEDSGFSEVQFVGPEDPDSNQSVGSSVVIAQGPTGVAQSPGTWLVVADENGVATELAAELGSRNQTVVLTNSAESDLHAGVEDSNVMVSVVEPTQRESWRSLLSELPKDIALKGVVHLAALDGHGANATRQEMSDDVTHAMSTALALVQGVIDSSLTPTEGVWFVTRGAQLLRQDFLDSVFGELAGAGLWGFGKVVSLEAPHLQPRMIDLDPSQSATAYLADELLNSDSETHIAYRGGSRLVARLVRNNINDKKLVFPEDSEWVIGSDDPDSGLTKLRTKPQTSRSLEPGEVRVAVEAAGLNFADVLISMGTVAYDQEIGREFYGRVLETAQDIGELSIGDAVVGMGFGSFAPEITVRSDLVSRVPAGYSGPALATMPICFVTAEIAFELAELKSGERVLIHAGAGGVGLAAIQLAQAIGAEIFTTASDSKREYLRSLGIKHVFDSRQTKFGEEILSVTGGKGVDVVLNSLTGEGFVEASLSSLGSNGRFVEIAKRNILSERQMSAVRPDVVYSILNVDELKEQNPAFAGKFLSRVIKRLSAKELKPLPHTVWPLSEIREAMEVMRDARHIGKFVLRMPPSTRHQFRQDRTYIVTGGMGGIGCLVARWLAEFGAGTIVLNGRRNPDPAAEQTIKELKEGGVNVRVEVADITSAAAVDNMLNRIDTELPPIGGIIHSVGVLSDGVIENQTWERFEQVLWPKVLGAWHLHQATRNKNLEFFILFSSVTGVVGNSGQTNHAAANAFLDQLAAHRRSLGLVGQAIAWGAWSSVGEAAEQRERIERQLAYSGAGWLTPEQGMEAFDWIVRQDLTAPTVTQADWSFIANEFDTSPAFFETLLSAKKTKEKESAKPTTSTGLLTKLQETSAIERIKVLESFVQEELQAVLRLSSTPSATTSFFDLGMDSLMAVQLRNRLNQAFADKYKASNTVIFDYPNISALAGHLTAELDNIDLFKTEPTLPVETTQVQSTRPAKVKPKTHRGESDGIAVVGMACRFPEAPNLAAFWHQLATGENAISDGRRDVGPWEGALGDPGAQDPLHRIGGFVDGLDQFDAKFFNIPPIEARDLDPQQRLLLETSWHALEDAGIDPASLRDSHSGVYFGISNSEYNDLMRLGGQSSYYGNAIGTAVGRVSYMFGMEGPAIPVELACASSLVSIHNAVAGLQHGETDLALAGGVNVILSSEYTSRMNEIGMLSPTGRCWSFDAVGDGYVRGEGCGVVVLKRLNDAEADGDRIWGVIRGSAVKQNGTSGGMMLPNGPVQQRVIEEALSRANIAASEVDYLEAHANGSNMGDSIEVQAVSEAYGNGREVGRPLLLGTVKANIGHTESAAGVAGLMKVLLAFENGVIPKQRNFETPNPNVDWDKAAVRVASEMIPWPSASDRPPRAGVSAFSLTGTNAHMIVEGYSAPENGSSVGKASHSPVGFAQPIAVSLPESVSESSTVDELTLRKSRILPLSGKTEGALHELATRYISWLDEHSYSLSSDDKAQSAMADMVWTASIGRSHFEHRAGIVFDEFTSLRKELASLAQSNRIMKPMAQHTIAFVYSGAGDNWGDMGKELYDSEPVVRSILDYCDGIIQRERRESLLDVMHGDSKDLENPAWSQPAVYALQCALTALWTSVGVRPDVVFGTRSGDIASAHAAGVLTLEQGLHFAARSGALLESNRTISDPNNLEATLGNIVPASPSLTMLNQITGRTLGQDETLEADYWNRTVREPVAVDRCVETLAKLGVSAIVDIGADANFIQSIVNSWPKPAKGDTESGANTNPPIVLSSAGNSTVDSHHTARGFVDAVSVAYEAGLKIDFSGLFAGESRRRISVPIYPFQHQSFWFSDS